MKNSSFWLALLLFLCLTVFLSAFIVDQRQYAVVTRLGKVQRVVLDPGLHFKFPLIDRTHIFDNRIHFAQLPHIESCITSEKKTIYIDFFVKWRVSDPEGFLKALYGSASAASLRVIELSRSVLRESFGRLTAHMITTNAEQAMNQIRDRVADGLRPFGIEVLDVTLKKVALPSDVSDAVFARMNAERKRVADELRALGVAESDRIRAEALKEVDIVIADAQAQADITLASARAQVSNIYLTKVKGFEEFFIFTKTMKLYK